MAAAAEESDAPRYVLIPLHGTGEAVAVDAERLPADHGDLVDILKGEQAPLHCWLHLARAYFKQGNTAAFLEILSEGTSPDAERVYETSRPERIAMLNALGAYYTGLGRVARRQKRDEVLIKVVDFYNKAARISSEEVATWVGKGQLQLVKGELHQAEEMFSLALAGVPDYVPALLGKACVLFQKGKFQDALNLYKKVLQMHPGCPASVRLGIGLCHLRLFSSSAARQPAAARREFHQAKARQALERVLQLEPGNADALVGLGLLDVNSDDAATVRRGVQRPVGQQQQHHVLGSAKQHLEVAEREEQQRKQRLEAERQVAEVEATKKRAEEDKLMEVERQRRDEEERRLLQQEEEIKRRVEMWKRNDRPKPVDDDDEGGDHGRGEGRSRKDREKERRKEKKRDKHRDRDRDRDRSREREEDGDRKERRKDKKRKKKKKHREARDDDREDGAGWGSDRGNRSDREERDEGENPWVDNERGEGSDGERGEKEAGGAAGNGAGDDALAAAGLVDDEDEGGGHARGDDDERGAPSRKRRRQLADSDEEDAAAPASSPHDATEAPQSHPH
ncbi:hypothetical protein CLOM_g8574 [Closterium sp. NIES-68]|nr:hypothetical protein CLOM_g8574 [Closterium sp. NIES-68]GJP64591.1 hypothetical protein CLOP_g21567 [Closterium sp. NIES-67]